MKDIAKYDYRIHPLYPNYYITKCGKVYSTLSNIFLSQKTKANGYKEVVLRKEGKSVSCLVHRLVLEAFEGIPLNNEVCNHKDRNRSNNNLSNLEWVTQKENCSEEKSNQKKLSQFNRGHKIEKCDENWNLIEKYPSVREAARQNGTADSTLLRALKLGRKSKGYYWRYSDV